jgi:cytochrome b involved in lipid metabolism
LSIALLSACARPTEVTPPTTTTGETIQTGITIETQTPPTKPTTTTTTTTNNTPKPPVVEVPVDPTPTPTPTSPSYTTADVAAHSTSNSCWSIVNGKVYNITSYIEKHPGGPEAILKICGKDGTSTLHRQHGTSKDNSLQKYYL